MAPSRGAARSWAPSSFPVCGDGSKRWLNAALDRMIRSPRAGMAPTTSIAGGGTARSFPARGDVSMLLVNAVLSRSRGWLRYGATVSLRRRVLSPPAGMAPRSHSASPLKILFPPRGDGSARLRLRWWLAFFPRVRGLFHRAPLRRNRPHVLSPRAGITPAFTCRRGPSLILSLTRGDCSMLLVTNTSCLPAPAGTPPQCVVTSSIAGGGVRRAPSTVPAPPRRYRPGHEPSPAPAHAARPGGARRRGDQTRGRSGQLSGRSRTWRPRLLVGQPVHRADDGSATLDDVLWHRDPPREGLVHRRTGREGPAGRSSVQLLDPVALSAGQVRSLRPLSGAASPL